MGCEEDVRAGIDVCNARDGLPSSAHSRQDQALGPRRGPRPRVLQSLFDAGDAIYRDSGCIKAEDKAVDSALTAEILGASFNGRSGWVAPSRLKMVVLCEVLSWPGMLPSNCSRLSWDAGSLR